jgi:putative hydrolase of HD superfamily
MFPFHLLQQIEFILEIDRLKQVLRQTLLTDRSRQENSAEHSWHIAIMAIVLSEYAPPGADLLSAIRMLLIHDLVEIDAGDTFCFDVATNHNKTDREQAAADRIFGLLPEEQGQELRSLWEEFEARKTPTAQFANALDRIQPVLHNRENQGGTWRQHGITQAQVLERVEPVKTGTPLLWPFVQQVIEDCIAAGFLKVN